MDAHGDYRAEAWLETHVGGPLYQYQASLPRLPIPAIGDTLQRFLPTALPLARTDEERTALRAAVQAFPGQAAALQERLQSRADHEYADSSWLQHWWNTLGYLDVRDTIVINVSYYFHFADDVTIYDNNSDVDDDTRSSPQIKRAAALLYTSAQVRNQVVTGTWPPEVLGRGEAAKPLCSTAYKYMFHACRIPDSPRDAYRIYDPSLYTHAAVSIRGHLFQIPLVENIVANSGSSQQQPVSMETLQDSLRDAVRQAATMPPASGLGWCTTQDRDAWAAARQALDASTLRELEVLESAAILVCLDDVDVHTPRHMAHLLLHGQESAVAPTNNNASTIPAINRWFDKSLQYVVTRNGKAGFVGEHSMMDGMPVVTLADKLASTTYADCMAASLQQTSTSGPSVVTAAKAQPILQSPLSETTMEHIRQAKSEFDEWVGKHDIHPYRFQGYGSDWIKKHAKLSPDAYVQMAMQIATYRLWDGQQGGTYEATQVRPFLHGRTETTRSVSTESAALVRRFGVHPLWHEVGDATARVEKLQLLKDAVAAHVQYIKWAANAQGVDRHFLGLALCVQEGEASPDLFADPVFQRSKTWRVSTSNLSHPKFVNWGYGEVTPMGVGLSYSIHPQHLQFSVTALKEHGWTDRLGQHLQDALLELQMLVEAEETGPTSKL